MSKSFFREEALNANKNGVMGNVALYSPPYRWLVISLVSFFVVIIICYVLFGTYTKKETASGYLLPAKGIYNITSPVTGTIVDMPVTKGSMIARNNVLMTISSELSTAMGQTRELIYQRLIAQKQQIAVERENENLSSAETLRTLRSQLASLTLQQSLLQRQQQQRQAQSRLVNRELVKLKTMREQGFASNKQVDEQQNNVLESEVRLQESERLIMDLAQRKMDVGLQLHEQPLTLARKQNEIDRKLADIERSLAENESQRAIYIKAPNAGTVGATLVKQGQVVNPGQPLLYILPQGSKLQAKIMVSSRAIGFINPGQRVMLRYDAYPYQKFGIQHGRVVEVSTAALLPQEVAAITGDNNVRERLFQVVVELDKQSINLYGKPTALRSGIKLEADFLVEKRRIVEWVLEPLYALGQRL